MRLYAHWPLSGRTGADRPQPVIDVAEMTTEELLVNGRRVDG